MKFRVLLVAFTLFLGNVFSYGQAFTATYDFASVTTGSGLTDPTPAPTATGVTFGSFIAVGTPANPNATGRFSFINWDTGATNGSDVFIGVINTGKYYQVTITPGAGYTLDINSITFRSQRSGTGPRQYAVRSSIDYTTNLPASISPANTNLSVVATNIFQVLDSSTTANDGNTITLGASYDALSGATTFRFYAWNAEAAGGSFGIDNVVINGVASTSTPPAVTLADNGTQVTIANVGQGTTNHILSTFQTTVANSAATLTTAAFATSGTYLAADIVANGFTLWRNSTANNFATATAIGTLSSTATGSGDILIFSLSPTVSLPVGTSYFWVTANIAAGATIGRTIRIDAIANADLTFTTGTKSGSASVAGFQTITIAPPAVPGSLTRGCTTNTTQVLNWSAPATGSYDGYLLVVRQGAVPHAVTTIFVPTQTTNLDYTLAPTYNATTSRVLYKTTAAANVSVTVTGLTAGLPYTFAVYAYKNNGASTLYSTTATTTSPTIGLPNVTSASTTAGNTSASLSWVNPNAACYDQVLVVVTATPGITFVPTGSSNLAYSPNTVFAGFNQAVYYSSGNLVNITGLTNGTTYYLELFVRNGSEWSSGVEVSVTPLNINPTVLKTGDLVLIAYDNNLPGGDDSIRLLTMVDINPGTRFLWANATYETGGLPAANVRTDKWFSCTASPDGNVPFLEFNYTGATVIPAGSIFCITTKASGTASTISAISPTGISFTSFTVTTGIAYSITF